MSGRPQVVVVGGGIAGLSAAWELGSWADVTVLEASSVLGGKLRTASIAGISVDVGAEAMLLRRTEGLRLIQLAGLGEALLPPRTTAASVYAAGSRHPLPAATMLGIPTDPDQLGASGLLSSDALRRVAAEPGDEPMPPLTGDVSVGDLVRRRLGEQVLDRLVEPLLGGVYAGRADALSTEAALPALAAELREGGSLIRAAHRALASGPSGDGPVFGSLPGGLGTLPAALAGAGRFSVRTGALVRQLIRTAGGFQLLCGPVPQTELSEADAVVIAVPPAKAAMLLAEISPSAAHELRGIESANVAIVTLAYRDVALPAGSGLLVGAREGLAVKGVTVTSQKWPLDTGGLTVLRASVGRAGEVQALQRDDRNLIALVRRDLRTVLGLSEQPVDALVTRWGGGLPQYALGHVGKVERIRRAVASVPGLAVCGAAYDGVGIPACIGSGRLAAERLVAQFTAQGQ